MGYVPDLNAEGKRVYGDSAICKGVLEDSSKCIYEVSDFKGWYSYQCQRNRGYGPQEEFCKQHAKIEKRRGDVHD